jgi:diacylglycerol kinase (ATP)
MRFARALRQKGYAVEMLSKIFASLANVERLVNAFRYSVSGIRAAIEKEAAFRQELALFAALAPLGIWLGEDAVQRVLLVGSLVMVMIVELLNSAIEATVDRIGAEMHKLSGRAKDMGSAAVLFSIMLAVFTWASILYSNYRAP